MRFPHSSGDAGYLRRVARAHLGHLLALNTAGTAGLAATMGAQVRERLWRYSSTSGSVLGSVRRSIRRTMMTSTN